MIKSIHHIDIIIPNGRDDQAREFYKTLLGFEEIEKPEVLRVNGGLWLSKGNMQLHLSYEKKEGVDPRKTKAHIAFEVDDIEKCRLLLQNYGCNCKIQKQIPNMVRFETEDPFGHRLEFLQIL